LICGDAFKALDKRFSLEPAAAVIIIAIYILIKPAVCGQDVTPVWNVSKSAMIALKDCMDVKRDDRVLIVTDTIRKDIGLPLFEAALKLGCDPVLLEIKPRERSGEEPPKAIAHAMLHSDVVFAATKVSMTHTQALKDAWRNGGRVASIPIQSDDHELVMRVFATGGMTADYFAMDRQIERLLSRLKQVREARITTDLGTDIKFTFHDRQWYGDKGIARKPGDHTNLPGGEVYIAPFDANGRVVVDGSFGDYGLLESPLELQVKDGFCISARGDRSADLQALFNMLGRNARNIAELGIGLNPRAKLCGIVLEDEKVGNTIHIALGNNVAFGGDVIVQMHYDGIVTDPTIYIDGEHLDLNDYLSTPVVARQA
jgi:aminopeptidase